MDGLNWGGVDVGWAGPGGRLGGGGFPAITDEPALDRERQDRGDDAHGRPAPPGVGVLAEGVTDGSGGEGSGGGPDLMGGEDPAEDDGAVVAEDLPAQRCCRRDRRDPVEAVDDDEEDHARMDRVREQPRQEQQADSPERVVRDEEDPGIELIGQPAGEHGADDVEDPDDREQTGRRRCWHPMVVGRGDEVDADEAVRRRSADRERDGQSPERPVPGSEEEPCEGASRGAGAAVLGGSARSGLRRARLSRTIGQNAQVRGAIAEDEPDQRHGCHRRDADEQGGRLPPGGLGDRGDRRQEDQLSGGRSGSEDAHDQTTAGEEPAIGDRGGEDECHRPCAQPDEHSPEDEQLPGRGHEYAASGAESDECQSRSDDLADAEAIHECRGEGGGEPVEQEVQAHGQGHAAHRPPEVRMERDHEGTGSRPESGGGEQGDERDGSDPPGGVDPAVPPLPGQAIPRCYRRPVGPPHRPRRPPRSGTFRSAA